MDTFAFADFGYALRYARPGQDQDGPPRHAIGAVLPPPHSQTRWQTLHTTVSRQQDQNTYGKLTVIAEHNYTVPHDKEAVDHTGTGDRTKQIK